MIELQKIKNKSGQSMVEIIVALGIFAILVSVLFVFSLQSLASLERSSYYNQALLFLNEGEEALRMIAKTNWDSFEYNQSAITTSSNTWTMVGEGSIENIGNFSRTVYFSNVYRDDVMKIVDEGHAQATKDDFSKYADIHVGWQVSGQRSIFLNKEILLTHYFASTTP